MSILLLLAIFVVLLLTGVPIAASLGVSSLLYLMFTTNLPDLLLIKTMVEGLDSFTLLAIPFFILAGNIMNEAGITTRIFNFARAMVGYLPGGLGHVNTVTSIIFAGMSGSAIADAGGTGAMEAKAMVENGFDEEFSVGLTAASSTIGPIIPPSIPMLVYGVIASVSVAELFAAGLIPGVLMGVSMMILTHFISVKRKFPKDDRFSFKLLVSTFFKAFWALISPILLVGGILNGIVTPTEAAIIAIVYSLFIGIFVYKGITFRKFIRIVLDSVETTVSVGLILASSAIFAWILAIEGAPQAATQLLLSLSNNPIIIALFIVVIMLVVGTFMEAGAAMVILVPVILPVADMVGIDRVYLGVVIVLTLMIGLLTPPMGLILFIMSRTMKMPVENVIRGTAPFLLPLIIVALLVTLVPAFSLWLPTVLLR